MRFLTRSLSGLALAILTLGLLALALGNFMRATEAGGDGGRAGGAAEERVYAVNVAVLAPETVRPTLTAYGWVESARQLELRAATAGTLVALAPGFRDGGRLEAGETLYRIDPADAQATLALALSDLEAARAEEAEAQAAVELAEAELASSRRQRDLRTQALERTRGLRERGIGTEADLEAAELALASAEQALSGQEIARAVAKARVPRAEIASNRAEIARDEAARKLAATSEVAPFDGVLSEVAAVPGRLVGANEKLGLLIDPAALEVAFRVSNAEFLRLADADGSLRALPLSAELEDGGEGVEVSGRIDRVGAAVGAGQTGRLIYATLEAGGRDLLRPGDFLTVRVIEPPLEGVAVLPATAVGDDGAVLVVGSDDRLDVVPVRVLRRQGDVVFAADAPFGQAYVTERLPQLGPGVRVRPVDRNTAPEAMIRLSPSRRAGLVAVVEASDRLPEAAKERLLVELEAEEVPQSTIDRLERRTGG